MKKFVVGAAMAVVAAVVAAVIIGQGRFAPDPAEDRINASGDSIAAEVPSVPETAEPVDDTNSQTPVSSASEEPPAAAETPPPPQDTMLLGPSGASGVVDYTTNPNDIHATRLTSGQVVDFRVRRTDSTGDERKDFLVMLLAPTATSLDTDFMVEYDYAQNAELGDFATVSYTPAASGVYYLAVRSLDDMFTSPAYGLAYTIEIRGSAGLPSESDLVRDLEW